jgi:flagellar biosynthesis protein FlhG
MKSLSDQDHYEILEIPRGAPLEQIEQAFRMAEATYADDSLAGYSVFGEGEAQALRERVAIAFRVLSEAESRAAYDAELAEPDGESPGLPMEIPAFDDPDFDDPAEGVEETAIAKPVVNLADLDALAALDDEDGEFDGARLRRTRLRCGVEIEDISGITKINPTYLRFIEEDRYAELPAPVYVRGFVRAYADCVGLDATRAAASYMKLYEGDPDEAPRGRFLSGR